MKRFLILKYGIIAILLFFSIPILGQNMGGISGTITDKQTGELIPGVQVYDASSARGTVTALTGKYKLDLPPGNYIITVSFVGYKTIKEKLTIEDGKTLVKNFQLTTDVFGLTNVVVTANFAKKTVFNSPLSITNIKARDLEKLATSSQADILRTVPGITAEGGGGEVATNVFVRGLPSGGQFQFTPLQVDGMPVLSAFGLNSSAHDVYFRYDIGIRDLEFVRGGISTLFGTGSVAGIINYSSYTGSAIPLNKIRLEWAEDGRQKLDFLATGPISDKTFYAFSGFYRLDEGPLETRLNTVGAQIRGNIKTLLNNGLGVFTVSGQYIHDKVQFYLPYPLKNDNGTYTRPTGNDGNEIFTMLTGDATDFSFDTPNGVYHSQIGDGVFTQGGYLMANLDMNFDNDWKFVAKARYSNYAHQFNLFLDGDGTHNVPETQAGYLSDRGLPLNAMFMYASTGKELASTDLLFENRILDRTRPLEDISANAYISKKVELGTGTHNFTLGVFSSYAKAGDDNWIYNYLGDFRNSPLMVNLSYVDSAGNTVDYTSGGYVNGTGRQTSDRHHALRKNAVYFADEMTWDKFSLDIGFRYEDAKGFITRETGIRTNTFQKGTVETNDFAVAIAALYKINPFIHLYVNGSKGYFFPEIRSVKFSSPGVPQSYEPERIYQAEAGVKIGTDKFAGTVAGYYTDLNDRRSVDFVNDGQGGVQELVKVQSTRTIGVELTASYYFIPTFNVFGDLTLQDHEYTEFQGSPTYVGNWLRRQPKVMGMVGLSYNDKKFDAQFTANIIGKKFANDANSVELDGYTIFRADVGYSIPLGVEKSLRIGVSAFNLFDVVGITEGSPRQGSSQIGGGQFFVGRPILPRRVFVSSTIQF